MRNEMLKHLHIYYDGFMWVAEIKHPNFMVGIKGKTQTGVFDSIIDFIDAYTNRQDSAGCVPAHG